MGGKCVSTFTHHTDKVQSVRWHTKEESLLLTGGYDKTLQLLDVRQNTPSFVLNLSADAEATQWHDTDDNKLFASAEDVTVRCFDIRKLVTNPDSEASKKAKKAAK